MAEIEKGFTEREKTLADAEKVRAETDAIRLETRIRELRVILGLTKALLIGDDSSEALVVGQRIDEFLKVLHGVS
jgi:hypothetical protein